MKKQALLNRPDPHTRVKLCEFESLDAAYEACQIGADALGFHLFKHQDLEEKSRRFADIFRYLPHHINKVLLTDVDIDSLVSLVLNRMQVDTIQLYPDWEVSQIADLRRWAGPGLCVLKVMSARSEENFETDDAAFLHYYRDAVDGILLDSYRAGGTGRTADWSHCKSVVERSALPVFLAGGLTADNVGQAIGEVMPFGVDVETGVSDRIPGGPLVKNMGKCRQFIDAVRTADRKFGRA